MTDRFNQRPLLSMVLACLLVVGCGRAGPDRPSGRVDWGSFDYRASEQRSYDNDADYRAPINNCLNDGIHTTGCE